MEDSVAAVDAADKVALYRNGLAPGQGRAVRPLRQGRAHDGADRWRTTREYLAPDGAPFALRGRSLLFVRNVGPPDDQPTRS